MRAWTDEFKKIWWSFLPPKCPICGNKPFKVIDGKGNPLTGNLWHLPDLWNLPNDSYCTCTKCDYKTAIFKHLESEVDIIKNDKLKSYSVADELLKWAKLKEDGHISEQEFDDARKKLLKRD